MSAAPARHPHIIYILSDEHRGQAMGHSGDPNLQTPNMDAMAAEGASFRRAYSNCPICTPSRGSIFSGRHAHAGPVAGFFDVYKPGAPSVATVLGDAGYRTAYFGKWHCGIVRDQIPPDVDSDNRFRGGSRNRTPECHRAGFQDWFGFENLNMHFNSSYYQNEELYPRSLDHGYETDAFTDLAIDYLNRHDASQPLFLTLSVTPPHFPMIVPEKWRRFAIADLEVRPNFTDNQDQRECLAQYYAMIENLDWNIGRLREALAATPGYEDTLLVYFSDHGDFLGSHGVHHGKEHPHEESVRIPAIFNRPAAIPATGSVDGLFCIVDMMATTLGLAGVPVPPWSMGTDHSPALRGEASAADIAPDAVLLEMVGSPRWGLHMPDWRGFVTDRWKYAYYENRAELLFDLHADPYEQTNLAPTRPDLCAEMRARLLDLLHANREPFFDVIIQHGVDQTRPTLSVRPGGRAYANSPTGKAPAGNATQWEL